MLPISHVTVGLLTHKKMFRVQTLWSEVFDRMISQTDEDLEISQPVSGANPSNFVYSIKNKKDSFTVHLGANEVRFVQSVYSGNKERIDMDGFIDRTVQTYAVVDDLLEIRGVRRIGIAAEHRTIGIQNPSSYLSERLFKAPAHSGQRRFILQLENRKPKADGTIPDEKKDAFTRTLVQYYDSVLDGDKAADDAINLNLDVQEFFTPPLTKGVVDSLRALYRKQFSTEWRSFQASLKSLAFEV